MYAAFTWYRGAGHMISAIMVCGFHGSGNDDRITLIWKSKRTWGPYKVNNASYYSHNNVKKIVFSKLQVIYLNYMRKRLVGALA